MLVCYYHLGIRNICTLEFKAVTINGETHAKCRVLTRNQ